MEKDAKPLNKKLKADLALVAALLALAAAAWTLVLLIRAPGAFAAVRVNGEEKGRYPLSEDTSFTVASPEGDSYNTVEIKDGYVRVTHAGCPDRVCVRTPAIRYNGQTIICLPNRLVIKIEGGEESPSDIDID